MAYKKKGSDGRKNNRPPKHTQFGQPGANKPYRGGKKKKKSTTVAEDIHAAFAATVEVTIDGKKVTKTKRQITLEQMANKAAQGDPVFVSMATPLWHLADDLPEFEPSPDDKEVMKQLSAILKDKDGGDES